MRGDVTIVLITILIFITTIIINISSIRIDESYNR